MGGNHCADEGTERAVIFIFLFLKPIENKDICTPAAT